VDAGGFLKGYSQDSNIQSEYLLNGMMMLGYDAVNLAIKDFTGGGEYLQAMRKKHDVPFVSSNVFYIDSKNQFVENSIIKKLSTHAAKVQPPFDKLTVGILGLCDEKKSLLQRNLSEPALLSREPIEAAKKAVAELHQADLILLLFNGRYATLESILAQTPKIDIVVVGGEYYKVTPATSGKTVMVSTPSLGKYFGEVTLTLNAKKQIIDNKPNEFRLTKKSKTILDWPSWSQILIKNNTLVNPNSPNSRLRVDHSTRLIFSPALP
jgi:2',3'-cyclic-nucleotide 2'-phosphodiesterase (5'-nucleotidase family)